MSEEKRNEKVEEVKKLSIDLQDLAVESYAKAFMAYRISLENWFLLNELLAYTKGEKLSPKDIQERLNKLFSVINSEIIREFVKLNNIAQKRALTKEVETEESASKEAEERNATEKED